MELRGKSDRTERSHTRDLFIELMIDPQLQGPTKSACEALEEWENVLTSGKLLRQDALDVELALIRIRRLRSLPERALDAHRLKRLVVEPNDNELTRLKHRLVTAEHELHMHGDYRSVEAEFESIAAKLRNDHHGLLHALVAIDLSIVKMMCGDLVSAEEFCQDSISICRRMGYDGQLAWSLNNYAVLKKKMCQYLESERLQRRAWEIFKSIGNAEGRIFGYNNLGIFKMKLGDWQTADHYMNKAVALMNQEQCVVGFNRRFLSNVDINIVHLRILQRRFSDALAKSRELVSGPRRYTDKIMVLMWEFLAQSYMETGELPLAVENLSKAREIAERIAPRGDVMTEIMRCQAKLHVLEGNYANAQLETLRCIRLCKEIGDKYEMGAVLGILGQVHAKQGRNKKAISAFEASIRTLKSINESYELMRSCIAYAEFLVESENADADIYLLEAKQLSKKLEIDYFKARIVLLSAKHAYNKNDYMTARSYLRRAEEITETLQACDRRKLKPQIRRFYKQLEDSILKSSMESAQKLRSIGKIYEDARFPIEELKPEMATEVALNVGASELFLIRKKNKGYRVPIKYNISADDAKRLIRFQLRTNPGLFETKDPIVVSLPTEKTLVCVPGQSGVGYLLCTLIDEERNFSPRELEFLFASVEAMERVAEEYAEVPSYLDIDDFIDGSDGKLTHPGGHFQDIMTLDPEMIKIIRLAERAAETIVPVLLEGETGVGKELFAQAIHSQSPRSNKQFIAMNAGGVPLNLLESELFGHVKGAFTDAVTDRHGLIEEARGGTIFFDEVGEMAEELQIKLLRLLENGEYRRLGENKLRMADVRVVSATNKDLVRRVEEGLFREDLFYRLATVRFKIPPLRNRKRDVEFLVRHFINDGLIRIGKPRRRINVDLKALEAFEIYEWPGNVREFKNEILRILSLIGPGDLIRFGMLSDHIKRAFASKGEDGGHLAKRVDRYERRLILKALEDNEWNRIRTAEQIGIPRTTLLFKMKRLKIAA